VPGDTRDDAVLGQTVRVVAERVTPRGVTRIVESRSGPVLAAAGVDASNVAPGTVLVLPPDPDAAARALRAGLAVLTGRGSAWSSPTRWAGPGGTGRSTRRSASPGSS
jgi:coenzyme F420-0:L-glutamate ligase/coenzyme F420-1:gamma-L-glutamate ligase